jgi:hypothetical protein
MSKDILTDRTAPFIYMANFSEFSCSEISLMRGCE